MGEAIANANSESLWDAVHKFDMCDSSSDPAIVRRAISKNIHVMLEAHKDSLSDSSRLEVIRGPHPLNTQRGRLSTEKKPAVWTSSSPIA